MKRRFRIGPATTLAIAAAIVIAYVKFPAWQRDAAQTRRIEELRAQVKAAPRAKALPPKTLDALWQRRAQLNLSAAQSKQLAALRAQEAAQIAPLQRAAEEAEREFETWMKAHSRGATMADIQRQAAPYSAASGALSAARRDFYERGLVALNEKR